MQQNKSGFGKINKDELRKSLRDGLLFVLAGAVVSTIAFLQDMDFSAFGDYAFLAQSVATAFIIPLLNRFLRDGNTSR
jgi:hypothetical protein